MNEYKKDRPTSEQLVDLLDNELEITICADVVHGLDYEYKQLQEENKKLNGAIQTHDILLKSNVEENKRLSREIDMWNKKYNDMFDENKQLKEQLENVMTMTVCGDKKQIKNTAQYKLEKAQQQNQELKDNWVNLKECLKEVMNSCNDDDKYFVETILDIMQELEGSDSNGQ